MKEFFLNVTLLLLAIGSLHIYDQLHDKELSLYRAMAPMQHLSDARNFILQNDYNGSMKELKAAIMAMKIVEQYTDSIAKDHIEAAIKDLLLVEEEIQNDSVIVSDLNKAFFKALNSIAFANLTISEASLDKGNKYEAIRYLNASLTETVNSLRFANDSESKAMETKAIEDIKKVLTKLKESEYVYQVNLDSINQEIEQLIE